MNVTDLRKKLVEELIKAFRVSPNHPVRFLVEVLFASAIQRFAELAAKFDETVRNYSFYTAVNELLPRFINGFESSGKEEIPENGPLIIVSNHPGTIDGLIISSCLKRNDLKIIVSGVPFIRSLSAASKHLIYSSKDSFERMLVIRSAVCHLEKGGSLLIFPSGGIDPDPAFMPGAEEEIKNWSSSLDIFIRKVPAALIQVVAVKGVLHPWWMNNVITNIRHTRRDKQRIAEFLQIIYQMLFPKKLDLHPLVDFAKPFRVDSNSPIPVHQTIISAMISHIKKENIENHA